MKRSLYLGAITILTASALVSASSHALESINEKSTLRKTGGISKKKSKKSLNVAKKKSDAISTSASATEKPTMVDGVEVELAPNAGKTSDSGATAAATTAAPSAGTSVAESSTPTKSSPLAKVIFNFNNSYYGAQLSEPFKMAQPDSNTGANSANARLESQVVLGYRVAPGHSVSAHAGFLTLAGTTIDGEKSPNVTAKPMASYVRYANGAIVKKGAFLWNGDLRFYPAVTDDLKCGGAGLNCKRDTVTGKYKNKRHVIRTGHNLSYDFSPKVNFTASNILRFRVREQQFQNGREAIFYESFLALNYNANDSLQFTLGYDMTAANDYGTSVFNFVRQGTYLEPSLSYNITPKVVLNPWIDIYTGNNPSFKTSQWGLNVLASIL